MQTESAGTGERPLRMEYFFERWKFLLWNDSFVDKLFDCGPNRRVDDHLGQQKQGKRNKQPAVSRKIKQEGNGDPITDSESVFYREHKQG